MTDMKNVSDKAIDEIAARFGGLPRPLLAAIGAGDMAVERLAELREQLGQRIGTPSVPTGDELKSFAADLPGRAQRIAGDATRQVQQFASAAPEQAQRLIGELPGRAS